jgi:polysaccharide biosynthesis transport protein
MTSELGTEPVLRIYLDVLRRQKWWVFAITMACVAASLAYSFQVHKQYTAAAQLLVQASAGVTMPGMQQQPVTQTDVQTALQLVTSAPVRAAVSRQIGVAPRVSVTEIGQTNVISVTAASGSPAQAARIANAYASAYVSYRQQVASHSLTAAESQLRSQIGSLAAQVAALHGKTKDSPEVGALLNQEAVLKEQLAQLLVGGAVQLGGVELVTPAQPPSGPSSPRPARNAALALAAGLALGLGAAFLRDSLDDRLSLKDAAEHPGGIPVMALIPMVTSWRKREHPLVASVAQPTSPAAEAYRSLRTSIQFCRQERQLRSLTVTSPAASEGKTATLANLGVVFAQAGERVVLVSCDLRRPRLEDFFGISAQAGMTTVLLGEHSLDEVLLQPDSRQTLWLLPAGPVPHNPAELLSGPAAQRIFTALRDRFDLVLIDSPPVLPVTDAVVLARQADATLMVVAVGQTRRADMRRAAEKMAQVNAEILGMVLNQVTKQAGYGYHYGYGYAYKPYRTSSGPAATATHPNGGARHMSGSPATNGSTAQVQNQPAAVWRPKDN